MVNAEDDEAPHGDTSFDIDGGYIPRIFFMDSNGAVKEDIINAGGNAKYKYFYSTEGMVNQKD